MEEKMKANETVSEEVETIEYEEVKHLSMGAFLGIGLAFGVAAGFSAGNLLFGSLLRGMAIFVTLGLLGGLIMGLINKKK